MKRLNLDSDSISKSERTNYAAKVIAEVLKKADCAFFASDNETALNVLSEYSAANIKDLEVQSHFSLLEAASQHEINQDQTDPIFYLNNLLLADTNNTGSSAYKMAALVLLGQCYAALEENESASYYFDQCYALYNSNGSEANSYLSVFIQINMASHFLAPHYSYLD